MKVRVLFRTFCHARVLIALACLGTFALVSVAQAGSLDLGVAGNYAVVGLGNGKTIGQNSGPVSGSELLGHGINANFSGGGSIAGTLYYDSTVTGTNTFTQFNPDPVTATVSTSLTDSAFNSAVAVSANAQALGNAPTQTRGNLTGGSTVADRTITGNGSLNVINISDIHNAPLTISGGAGDTFVFNVAGSFDSNVGMTLSGVLPSQILWNLLGTSGNIFTTSGGNTVYGTFLSTRGGNFQFSNLNLNGALINTAGGMQIVSGSEVNTFTPFTAVPLPAASTAGMALLGGLGLVGVVRRRLSSDRSDS